MSVIGDVRVDPCVDSSSRDTEEKEEEGNDVRRKRSLSFKGKVYQQEQLLKRRKSLHNRLLRQLKLVAQCLECTSVEMTNQEMLNMDRIFSELVDTNMKYSELLDEDADKEQCQTYFETVDDEVFQMKTKVCT